MLNCSIVLMSCSTNLIINRLYNFNTSELYCVKVVNCIVVSLFFLFFALSLYCFVCLVSVCLSVRLLPLWRMKIYTTASADSADSAISVTPVRTAGTIWYDRVSRNTAPAAPSAPAPNTGPGYWY